MTKVITSRDTAKISRLSPGEIRIPARMLCVALQAKQTKALALLAAAKLQGHRAEIKDLLERLGIHIKTGRRLIAWIVSQGWAGTDGKNLFPRAWRKMKFNKRRGLYITEVPNDLKRFESLCFSHALKKVIGRKASPARSDRGRTKQSHDLPSTYLVQALGLKERRFKSLKASAQKYGFIRVHPQVSIIGRARDFPALRKNMHGPPVFVRGEFTVVPDVSRIQVLI